MSTSARHEPRGIHPAVLLTHRVRVPAYLVAGLIVISTLHPLRVWPIVGVALVAICLPWVILWLSRRSPNSGSAAARAMLVDAFLAGLWIGVSSFRLTPLLTLVTVIGIVDLTMGGVRYLARALAAIALGALASLTFATVDVGAPTRPLTYALCVVFILATSWLVSYLVNATTKRFIETRRALTERNQELEELNRIARMVNSTLDLDDVIKTAMRGLNLVFAFDQLAVLLVDKESGSLVLDRLLGSDAPHGGSASTAPPATSGSSEEASDRLRHFGVPLDEEASVFVRVVKGRERLFLKRITPAQVAGLSPSDQALFELSPVKALAMYPLEIEGDVLGVIAFGNTRTAFDFDEVLFDTIGRSVTQIATAIRNARLFDAAERSRAAAVEANDARAAFLTHVSQELRGPLAAVVGQTELLRSDESVTKTPALESHLSRIHDAGQRLRALVEDVLEISQIEAGETAFSLSEVPLAELVNEAVAMARPLAEERNARIAVEIADDGGELLRTDRPKVEKVLLAAVARALERSTEGTVELRAARSRVGDRVVFTVLDEGTDTGRSRRAAMKIEDGDRGTEGLAVARRFCKMMGGDLTIAALARDSPGSRVVIDLPARLSGPLGSRERATVSTVSRETAEEEEEEPVGGRLLDGTARFRVAELLSRLRTNEVLGAAPEPSLLRLASVLEVRCFAAGEVLVEQGARADRLFLLLEGKLGSVVDLGTGHDHVLDMAVPGAIVGEVAILYGIRRSARITAVEESWVACLKRAEVERLVGEDEATGSRLSSLAASRLLRTQLATHLRSVFGEMDDELLALLMREAKRTTLASGETLFRHGDQADAVHVVLNGRLEVVVDGRVIAEVGRGESIGEMAILTAGTRSATVAAVRDCELARIPNRVFERLLMTSPRAAAGLTRLLARRLERRDARSVSRAAAPSTFAVVAASPDVNLEDCARRLADALGSLGSTLLVDPARVEAVLGAGAAQALNGDTRNLAVAQWLAELEGKCRYLVYQADRTWTPWTHRAVRQADRVILAANAAGDPERGELEQRIQLAWKGARAPRCDLLLLHAPATEEPRGTLRWLEVRSVERHHHARRGSAADFARIARILTGNALGLVLGGGGARCFAHIGVVRALEELSVPVDLVAGTSFGACVAAAYAIGNGSAGMLRLAERYFSSSIFDVTLPLLAFLESGIINRNLKAIYGHRRIEDLWIPFFCMSTNLTQAESVTHTRGPIVRAVRASLAIPGVLPPVIEKGDVLVDGGLFNNVPADVMRAMVGGGRVLAVDVGSMVEMRAHRDPGMAVSGWKLLAQRLTRRSAGEIPTIADILNRVVVVESARSRSRIIDSRQADLYITLPLPGYGMMEFQRFAPLARLGYEGSIEELRHWLTRMGDMEVLAGPPSTERRVGSGLKYQGYTPSREDGRR